MRKMAGLCMRNAMRCLFVVILVGLVGCATMSGNGIGYSYLENQQYERAIEEYRKELASATDKMLIMRITTNMGVAYSNLYDYDSASEYYLKSIEAKPELGYYGYINLASVEYFRGKIREAYEYSVKARKMVNSSEYYSAERTLRSAYDKDTVKNHVIAMNDFFLLRLRFRELSGLAERGDYKKAVQVAEEILSGKRLVYFGMEFSGPVIAEVQKGSVADLNGFVRGDRILEINGRKVSTMNDAYNETSRYAGEFGTSITVKILRKGRTISVACQLTYPEIDQAKQILSDAKSRISGKGTEAKKNVPTGPAMKIVEPRIARSVRLVTKGNVDFVILASDEDGVGKVSVNGSDCTCTDASSLESMILPGKVRRCSISLQLLPPKQRVVVEAIDKKGAATKEVLEIAVEEKPVAPQVLDRIYDRKVAVVIGVNKYEMFPPLEFAVNDAKSIRDRLVGMGYDKVIEVYDREATRVRLMRVLADELSGVLGKNDALFVYFAGHGLTESMPDGGVEGYIAPVDTDRNNFPGTAISMTSIRELIKKYQAKHILLVFDSCYAGLGLVRGGGSKTGDAFILNAARKKAAQIITAGGKEELAQESKGHGLFTRVFLEILDGKSGDKKEEYLVASDVGPAISKQVTRQTKGEQNPLYGWLAGEGDFIFEGR